MKKIIIAVILALTVSILAAVPAYAAAPQKIKSVHPQFAEKLSYASVSGERIPVSSLQNLGVYPGSELEIVLAGRGENADLFFDQNGKPVNTADVTASKMRATGVTSELYAETGEDLIESVGITVQNAGTPAAKPVLRVCFVSDFDGLNPESFSFTVYISIGGVRQEQSGINIAGTLGNPEITANSSDAGIYADGFVISAEEDIPYIELHAGCGVTVAASLKQGGRCRVQAKTGDEPSDMAAMEKHNALADVIELEAYGFEDGDITGVRIETAQPLSAYDENGEFLGVASGTEVLPFREKYYLVWRDTPLDIAEIIKPLP